MSRIFLLEISVCLHSGLSPTFGAITRKDLYIAASLGFDVFHVVVEDDLPVVEALTAQAQLEPNVVRQVDPLKTGVYNDP